LDAIENLELSWKITFNNDILSQGKDWFGQTAYYSSSGKQIKIKLPENLPAERLMCNLELDLSSKGISISQNKYEILITSEDWIEGINTLKGRRIGLFDLTGKTQQVFDLFGIPYFLLKDLTEIRIIDMDLLVVANLDSDNEVPYSWEDVRRMAGNGLNTLLIHPGKHLKWLYYYEVESIYERQGRITNMRIPEHVIFTGLESAELAWWQQEGREPPRSCRRSYRFRSGGDKIHKLVEFLRPHVYLGNPAYQLYEMTGYPLVEFEEGSGKIIASEMELNQAVNDPVAAKLLVNILTYLSD